MDHRKSVLISDDQSFSIQPDLHAMRPPWPMSAEQKASKSRKRDEQYNARGGILTERSAQNKHHSVDAVRWKVEFH